MSKMFESGVSKCYLYPIDSTVESGTPYANGVPWTGITSVSESPSGADITNLYADNVKYAQLQAAEEFGATVEAYTYPDEFAACDGSASLGDGLGATFGQQSRKMFGLSYRTEYQDGETGNKYYKLHLVYGLNAKPSERAYETINDSPDAITFSWEMSSTPVTFTENGATYSTSIITVDSKNASATGLAALEALLYGNGSSTQPKLPLPAEVKTALATA